MAISVFPAPVTTSVASTLNVNTFTIATANTINQGSVSLDPAIYTITCVNTIITTIEFYFGQAPTPKPTEDGHWMWVEEDLNWQIVTPK